jgi:O-antigen ligase
MSGVSTHYAYPGTLSAAEQTGTAEPPESHRAGFFLFLVVTAVMFIRPAEIVPALDALPIYEVCIIGALLFSASAVLRQLSAESLARAPITCCVIGFLVAVFLSNAAHFDLFTARKTSLNFSKVVLYYLLLVGLVRSVGRFRTLLVVVLFLTLVVTVLALLRYHDIVDVLKLEAHVDNRGELDEFGERTSFLRLMAAGIFSDPNDFSLVLVNGILICSKFVLDQKRWLMRFTMALPIVLLMYAVVRTYSRGGFLALLAGIATLFVSRYGFKKAIPIVLVVLPVVAIAVGGRQLQIDFSDEDDTAAGRVEIWSEGLHEFKSTPLFGIGASQMFDVIGIVAHNSFVHSFVETGLLGGTFFIGMFFLPVTCLWRLRDPAAQARLHPALREWRPYVLAVMVAFSIGLCSLSRCYVVSTYLVIGMAAAFVGLLAEHDPAAVPRMSVPLAQRVTGVSIAVLVASYVFTKIVL